MTVKSAHLMTAHELYERLKHIRYGGEVCHYTLKKCEEIVPLINEINELKMQKNAVILVHSYVSPDIIYGVGDFAGDSYGLSKNAMTTTAETIVFVAVRFMGETAKILNPEKEVLLPGPLSGCTLADAVTAEDVRNLRKKYPKHTFVCYINTTAEVKAECDVSVTSANAYRVVAAIPNPKIYFLPDKLMGRNIQDEMKRTGIDKEIEIYDGTCYVHEEYDPSMIDQVRLEYEDVKVVSHPECNSGIIAKSDYVGSTSQMADYIGKNNAKRYMMLTECGMAVRLQAMMPEKEFVGSCTLCRYMKSNTLAHILRVLKNPTETDRIVIKEDVRQRAARSLEAMFRYTEG